MVFLCCIVIFVVYMYLMIFVRVIDEICNWSFFFFWDEELCSRVFLNVGEVVVMRGLWIVNWFFLFWFFKNVVVNFFFMNMLKSFESIFLWLLNLNFIGLCFCWFLNFFWIVVSMLMLYLIEKLWRLFRMFLFIVILDLYMNFWKYFSSFLVSFGSIICFFVFLLEFFDIRIFL